LLAEKFPPNSHQNEDSAKKQRPILNDSDITRPRISQGAPISLHYKNRRQSLAEKHIEEPNSSSAFDRLTALFSKSLKRKVIRFSEENEDNKKKIRSAITNDKLSPVIGPEKVTIPVETPTKTTVKQLVASTPLALNTRPFQRFVPSKAVSKYEFSIPESFSSEPPNPSLCNGLTTKPFAFSVISSDFNFDFVNKFRFSPPEIMDPPAEHTGSLLIDDLTTKSYGFSSPLNFSSAEYPSKIQKCHRSSNIIAF